MTTDEHGAPVPAPVRRYVLGWAVLAAAAIAGVAAVTGVGFTPRLLWLVPLLVAATTVLDAVELVVHHDGGDEAVSLIEVGVVLSMLVLPGPWPLVVVGAALVISHGLLRRRRGLKTVFNAAQNVVATVAALAVIAPLGTMPDVSLEMVLRILASLLVYELVTVGAMAGLFRSLGDDRAGRLLGARVPLVLLNVFCSGPVGAIAYVLLVTNPVTLPLLVPPVVALHLAHRGEVRTRELLGEVEQERDRLDRVVVGASDGIVLLERDGTVSLWNPAMEAITGRDADDVLGRPAPELLTGMAADGAPVDPTEPLRTGTNAAVEATISGEHDVQALVRLHHTVLCDGSDRAAGDVIIVRDLDRERAATSLKEDFVARVSHELRTPLTPIRGYAQVLLRTIGRVDEQQQRKVYEQIIERVDHLEALIDDLLLVSRITSGSIEDIQEVDEKQVDVEDLVERLREWFVRDHPDRTFTVTCGDGWQVARGDELRIGQIVTNLLSNACKYSPPGSEIELRVERDGDTSRVRVTDHGHGIPRDRLDHVFERFQRLEDPLRMKTGGMGLGLYISRHLARRMGGDLTVESELGVGSTFTLELPAAEGPPASQAEERAARRRRGPVAVIDGAQRRDVSSPQEAAVAARVG